jgi:DNA-binding GntR family transcriptional regulator
VAEPSYAIISKTLQDDIAGLDHGARIASEHALQKRFGVSRATARAALDELESQLLIRRVRGLGTFVNRPFEYRIARDGDASWWEAVRAAGRVAHHVVKDARVVPASPALATTLGVDAGELVSAVTLAGFADEALVAFGTSWVSVTTAPDLARTIRSAASLEAVLRQGWNLDPVRARCRVTMETPPTAARAVLELSSGALAWHVTGTERDGASGPPIVASDWWFRSDAVRVVAEL